MKRHHRLHHDPKVMRKWNFNIGIPLFDVLFRTLAPAEEMRDADNV
jgi:sterol desaturase/sphingolipid hydroxylase (fatty acid hydroxylase superfamily)